MGRSEGGQWVRLRDPSSPAHGTLTIWVPANHGSPIDLGNVANADSLAVTGVVTSYQDNADDPVVWQLVPRDAADVEVSAHEAGMPGWLMWAALVAALGIGTWLATSRISARRQLHALRETEARYAQLLALLPDAVIVHARGSILFTNPAAADLLGLPSYHELVGRPLADFVHPDSMASLAEFDADRAGTAPEQAPRVRAQLLTASGVAVDVEVASSPCLYHDRPAMVLLARDITAQLRYERDLHALALVDELTGLQNRRAFTLFAEQELARARRNGRTPVLVFADLDGLKHINDEHGHAAGDAAIRIVANALRSIFREADIVARWSGDEFVALMVEGSDEAAQLVRSRLDAAIKAQSPAELPYVVTASVGASPLDPALPLRDAMERADAQLYAQKKRQRRSKIRATPIHVSLVDVDIGDERH
jgi:diguanylate cyclase (GGDEF)-like protein/PAS domain S-box-containing protein